MSDEQKRSIQVGDEEICFDVTTSGRATRMRIDVDLHNVRVVVPEGHPGDPEAFVRQKSDWIRRKQRAFAQFRDRVPDRSFREGASFPYLGEEKIVLLEDRGYSLMTEQHFLLSRKRVNQGSIKEELEHLYRREARKVYEQFAEQYAKKMGVSYGTLAVRNQKTKWGSCSPKKTLSFNWRVIMAPEKVVRYLVIHELAHLEVRNHSKAFWDLVSQYDPAYQKHAEWLKKNSAKLVYSEDDL